MRAFNVVLTVYKIFVAVLIIAALVFAIGILVDDEISEWKYYSDGEVMECAPRMLLVFMLYLAVNVIPALLALIGAGISSACKSNPVRKKQMTHFFILAISTLCADVFYFTLMIIAAFI